jgi:DNA-binding protein YbaB
VKSLVIKPEAYDADDPDAMSTVADLVVAALRDATDQVRKLAQDAMGPLAGGLPGMPGMPGGMPGLPGA